MHGSIYNLHIIKAIYNGKQISYRTLIQKRNEVENLMNICESSNAFEKCLINLFVFNLRSK